MKYIVPFLLIFQLFISFNLVAQFDANEYTDWSTKIEYSSTNNQATLVIKAKTAGEWYGYSTKEIEDGPFATEISFNPTPNYELIGGIEEIGMKESYDEMFDADLLKFTDGEFRQKIRLKGTSESIITGSINYQICTEGKCILGEKQIEFVINPAKGTKNELNASKEEQKENEEAKVEKTKSEVEEQTESTETHLQLNWEYTLEEQKQKGTFLLTLHTQLKEGVELKLPSTVQDLFKTPNDISFNISPFMVVLGIGENQKTLVGDIKLTSTLTNVKENEQAFIIKSLTAPRDSIFTTSNTKNIVVNFANAKPYIEVGCTPKKMHDDNEVGFSYWELMIEAFLWGIASLLTPCVFPMIPMTVTFFLKDAKEKSRTHGIKKAMGYGFSIIGIYTLIGTIVAVTLGAAFANWLATHWIPNILFFLIFMFFAASFLGLFEIRLPNWMINKSDQQADKGGFVGTFFMALTLVLVSFSCTGPIVGIILIKASQGAIVEPMLGMFAFSLAFALPFTLFAIFPSWLSKLPKSGGWLNTVKVVLGFLEIALGLKFLSVADQTYHWGLLDREVYIGIWIVIFTLLALYLLGKLKFAHDSDLPFIKVPRLFFAMAVLSFVVYLTPGLIGHPLKMLSGYLPPMSSHDFNLLGEIRGAEEYQCDEPLFSDFLHLPHGIAGYFDYEQALACSRAQNKPLFIDFTGHGCVNCREMEAKVWSDPAILKQLKEKFIVVALYVDDKKDLPEEKWYKSRVDGKLKKTIGDQNLDFQICNFDENAQPLYVTLDANEELLAKPVGYVSKDVFEQFLKKSLVEFKKQKKGQSPI